MEVRVTAFYKSRVPLTDEEMKKTAQKLKKGLRNLFPMLTASPSVVFLHGSAFDNNEGVRVALMIDAGNGPALQEFYV